MSRRTAAFVAVCGGLGLLAAGYVGWSVVQVRMAAPPSFPAGNGAGLARVLGVPHLVFLQPSGADPSQSTVAVAPLDNLQDRQLTGLTCARAYFAAGHGVCLGRTIEGGGFTFDASLRRQREFDQVGLSTRARVSPDGHKAATTVFVTGHGYADLTFSTQTLITDLRTGAQVDLEKFSVTRDGTRIQRSDFNFWGITFASQENRFYATLATGGQTYLIAGDTASRSARTLRENVECPSLSPDGTRIVYKQLLTNTGGRRWRLHMLDLRTGADSALAETRSVDDQVEWLDGGHVLYGLNDEGPPATLDVNLWELAVDGSAAPARFLAHAASPAVVRPA
jgi:Tol biopolymer transport system component